MKRIFLFIVLCIYYTTLNAQIETLFEKFIPEKYLNDPDSKEISNRVLEECKEVDPALIYYYLTFLKMTELKSIDVNNYWTIFYHERNKSLKRIQTWIEEEMEIVNKNSISLSQWFNLKKSLNFLSSFPNDSKAVNINFKPDDNFKYFIIYIHFLNKYSDYNKELDYKELINYFFKNLVAEFDNVYENTENLSLEELEIYLEKAEKYTFLFQNSYYEFISVQTKMRYSSFILKLSSIGYLENKNIFAGLGTRIKGEIKQNLSYKDPANYIISGDLIFDTKISSYISTGIKIPLRKYKTFFSNLTMLIQYQVYSQHNENYKPSGPDKFNHLIKLTNKLSALVETYLKIDNLKTYSISSIFLKASTPILFFNPDISLELGTFMHYVAFNYDYQINRNDRYLYPQWYYDESLLTNYNKKFSAIYNHISIVPYLSLNINLYNLIDLRLNTDTNAGIPLIEFYFNYSL